MEETERRAPGPEAEAGNAGDDVIPPERALQPALAACRAVCATVRAISYDATVMISRIEELMGGESGDGASVEPSECRVGRLSRIVIFRTRLCCNYQFIHPVCQQVPVETCEGSQTSSFPRWQRGQRSLAAWRASSRHSAMPACLHVQFATHLVAMIQAGTMCRRDRTAPSSPTSRPSLALSPRPRFSRIFPLYSYPLH